VQKCKAPAERKNINNTKKHYKKPRNVKAIVETIGTKHENIVNSVVCRTARKYEHGGGDKNNYAMWKTKTNFFWYTYIKKPILQQPRDRVTKI